VTSLEPWCAHGVSAGVSFRTTFPVTAWIVHKLTTRVAIGVYCVFVAFLGVAALYARIESFLFVRRTEATLTTLASIHLGDSRSDVLKIVQGLQTGEGPKLFATTETSQFYSRYERHALLEHVLVMGGHSAYRFAYFLGFRYWEFEPHLVFENGKLKNYGYFFRASSAAGKYATWPTVRVGSVPVDAGYVPFLTNGPIDGKNFVVSRVWKWPKYELHVAFTGTAPRQAVEDAFNPKLTCMWLSGCSSADELLPNVGAD
jgi:hypothetical protein